MTRQRWLTDCVRCHGEGWHQSRNLCEQCNWICRMDGTLDDWPRITWRRDELISEWQFLARQGHTRQQCADRLGITKKRLEKAIERHRRSQRESAA